MGSILVFRPDSNGRRWKCATGNRANARWEIEPQRRKERRIGEENAGCRERACQSNPLVRSCALCAFAVALDAAAALLHLRQLHRPAFGGGEGGGFEDLLGLERVFEIGQRDDG